MKLKYPWKRLQPGKFWHLVDEQHNRSIAEHLQGCQEILDVGCGYGSLTAYLAGKGFSVSGIDTDPDAVAAAVLLFPQLARAKIKVMSAESLNFPDNFFDAVVLRDTLHHIFAENDPDCAFSEIERVLKPNGRLVILDPNPSFAVLACRRLINHKDACCSFPDAVNLLTRRDWRVKHVFFSDLFALALSGGYVGISFVPDWQLPQRLILTADNLLSGFIRLLHLEKAFLWRYGIVAEHGKIQNAATEIR